MKLNNALINERVVANWLHEASWKCGEDCKNMGWGLDKTTTASHGAAWFAKILVDLFQLDEDEVSRLATLLGQRRFIDEN